MYLYTYVRLMRKKTINGNLFLLSFGGQEFMLLVVLNLHSMFFGK